MHWTEFSITTGQSLAWRGCKHYRHNQLCVVLHEAICSIKLMLINKFHCSSWFRDSPALLTGVFSHLAYSQLHRVRIIQPAFLQKAATTRLTDRVTTTQDPGVPTQWVIHLQTDRTRAGFAQSTMCATWTNGICCYDDWNIDQKVITRATMLPVRQKYKLQVTIAATIKPWRLKYKTTSHCHGNLLKQCLKHKATSHCHGNLLTRCLKHKATSHCHGNLLTRCLKHKAASHCQLGQTYCQEDWNTKLQIYKCYTCCKSQSRQPCWRKCNGQILTAGIKMVS